VDQQIAATQDGFTSQSSIKVMRLSILRLGLVIDSWDVHCVQQMVLCYRDAAGRSSITMQVRPERKHCCGEAACWFLLREAATQCRSNQKGGMAG
jgi:hypothetical protein